MIIEAWGSKNSNDISIIVGKGNNLVINGAWWLARSEDGKHIWCTETESQPNENSRFLGYFEVKSNKFHDNYNDMILEAEEQMKNNPELISKDGICEIPKDEDSGYHDESDIPF